MIDTPCAIEVLFPYLIEIAVCVNDKCDIENTQNGKQCLWLKKNSENTHGKYFYTWDSLDSKFCHRE